MKHNFVAQITEILGEVSIVENLARKKFIGEFIIGLIKSRNVQFCEVAQHLRDSAKLSSNEVRIQDFFREVSLDYQQVAILLLSFLPRRRKLRLCIDRTNWEFGCYSCNILMVSVSCGEFSLPFYWEMLDNKGGNSSQEQRIDLLKSCIDIIGEKRIGLLIGDREFIGHHWLKHLKNKHIRFIVRMPKHHKMHCIDGQVRTIKDLDILPGQIVRFSNVLMNGVVGNVYIELLDNGDYLFLFGTVNGTFIEQLYRKRWCIESCFQNLKGRGFDLEKSHLKADEKLSKLVALVSIAYGLVVSTGVFYHQKVQSLKKRNMATKKTALPEKVSTLLENGLEQLKR